jgi:rubredoxin
MLHEGQESSSRKLIWTDRQNFKGWGCTECDWVFNPSGPPIGESLEEMKRNFEMQLSEEFAAHACAKHPRAKGLKFFA